MMMLITSCAAMPPGVVDSRLVGKSPSVDGQESHWEDWSFSFGAYCTLLDKRYGPGMRTAAASAVAIVLTVNEDELALQTQLYYLMVCMLSGPALRELKTVARPTGWRHGGSCRRSKSRRPETVSWHFWTLACVRS